MNKTAFIKVKQQLSGINTLLKQGKLLAAAHSLHKSLAFVLRTRLMQHEKKEFEQQIEWAVYQLSHDPELKKVFPLLISYTPGEEKQLHETVTQLLATLEDIKNQEAQDQLKALEKKQQEELAKAQEALDAKEYDKARHLFATICEASKGDMALRAEVGERFFNAQCYDEAIEYLQAASTDEMLSSQLFNKLGMALRKSKRFEEAEAFYLKALTTSPDNPSILFNLGRVYIDWRKWKEVEQTAQKALTVNPDFKEAHKMLQFAQKHLRPATG